MRSKISLRTVSPVTVPPVPSWPVRMGCCTLYSRVLRAAVFPGIRPDPLRWRLSTTRSRTVHMFADGSLSNVSL